jgi:AAA domain
MSFTFRPAIREQTHLLIAISGPSGAGKTLSALKVARGLVGGDDKKIAAVDTEGGRALHYAPGRGESASSTKFLFHWGELTAPFTPERYEEAIKAGAELVGPGGVVVVDSASHEWEGEGGLQDIHQEELIRITNNEPRRFEAMTAPAWRTPKIRHKRFINHLIQLRVHLVFCLRAEEKIKFVKQQMEENGRKYEKTQIVNAGWLPICEKRFMYEMTCSMMVLPDNPGKPVPIKIQDQHRHAFPEDQFISERSGELMRLWALGNAERLNEVEEEKPSQAPRQESFIPENDTAPRRERFMINKGRTSVPCETIDKWRERMVLTIDTLSDTSTEAFLNLNTSYLNQYEPAWPEEVQIVRQRFLAKIGKDR